MWSGAVLDRILGSVRGLEGLHVFEYHTIRISTVQLSDTFEGRKHLCHQVYATSWAPAARGVSIAFLNELTEIDHLYGTSMAALFLMMLENWILRERNLRDFADLVPQHQRRGIPRHSCHGGACSLMMWR
eukprot:COSAG02_NODE_92_length_37588_cov_135.916242_2_plen_130_part_00